MTDPLSREPLDPAEITRRLADRLEGWQAHEVGGRWCLEKEFSYPSFVEAFSFMTGVALVAERLNHHPDWSNVYNRVRILLSTHDAGGVTDFDFSLAEAADRLSRRP